MMSILANIGKTVLPIVLDWILSHLTKEAVEGVLDHVVDKAVESTNTTWDDEVRDLVRAKKEKS